MDKPFAEVEAGLEKSGRVEELIKLYDSRSREVPPPEGAPLLNKAAELAKADAEGKLDQRAKWLDIIGQTRAAAETWEKAERPGRASHLWEKLGELSKAAALAEAAREHKRAAALFEKLGDAAAAERNKALAATQPEPPAASVDQPTEAPSESTAGGQESQ